MLSRLALVTALALPGLAADFTGPEACAECHPRQWQQQRATHHFTALRKIAESPLAKILDGQSLRERNGTMFQYRLKPEGVAVSISKGSDRFEALLEWSFGSGSKAFTPVGRFGEDYFEHRVSWYKQGSGGGRLGLTPGHSTSPPRDSRAAAGIVQTQENITRCFRCHATSEMIPGVTCERCHGPGAAHIAAARRAAAPVKNTIFHPGRLNAQGIVSVCAECHRSPNEEFRSPMPEIDDPLSVRFAPVGFTASQCFQKSKTFSCISCHSPHEDPLPASSETYTAVCRQCHASGAKACKRKRTQACVACHMKSTSPTANLSFTDHRIRVYLD